MILFLCRDLYVYQIGKPQLQFLWRYSLFPSWSMLRQHDEGFCSLLQECLLLHSIVFYIQKNPIISARRMGAYIPNNLLAKALNFSLPVRNHQSFW